METMPTALTVRWISTGAPADSWVQDGRAGGRLAGRAPVSTQPGQVDAGQPGRHGLEMLAIQTQVHGSGVHPQGQRAPACAGPSQNCWPQTLRLPLAGTNRSISTASMIRACSKVLPVVRRS
jgi:hypothetical protein